MESILLQSIKTFSAILRFSAVSSDRNLNSSAKEYRWVNNTVSNEVALEASCSLAGPWREKFLVVIQCRFLYLHILN